MGLHTGEPIVTDEGYVGIDVHRAARIAAAAHGGQIVVSETTRRLLDADTAVRDLGEHRLKDLIGAERLYQLGEGDFPPLRTLDATNLPVAASPLVGRERELEELVALLSNGTRLLTVTGPEAPERRVSRSRSQPSSSARCATASSGCRLPASPTPSSCPPEVAQAIGRRDDLAGFLRGRELSSCSTTSSTSSTPLRRSAPSSRLRRRCACWSRAVRRCMCRRSGSTGWSRFRRGCGRALRRAGARRRAEVAPDSTVESICRRLDGLPLAVELAAARTKLLASRARSSSVSTRLFRS